MGLIRYITLERRQTLPPIEPAEISGKSFDLITAAGGIFVRATRPEFDVILPHTRTRLPGLTEIAPALTLRVPRIPGAFLERIFAHANRVENARRERVEALYYFRYDEAGQEWELIIPPQIATPAAVKPLDTGKGSPFDGALVELHSHHDLGLGARFSTRDNLDEKTRVRLFSVIGHTSRAPELRLRVGVFGNFWEVPAELLFEMPRSIADSLSLDAQLRHEATTELANYPHGLAPSGRLLLDLARRYESRPTVEANEEDEEQTTSTCALVTERGQSIRLRAA